MALEIEWLCGNLADCVDAAGRVRGTYGFGITAAGRPFWDPEDDAVFPDKPASLHLDMTTGKLLLVGRT